MSDPMSYALMENTQYVLITIPQTSTYTLKMSFYPRIRHECIRNTTCLRVHGMSNFSKKKKRQIPDTCGLVGYGFQHLTWDWTSVQDLPHMSGCNSYNRMLQQLLYQITHPIHALLYEDADFFFLVFLSSFPHHIKRYI